MGEKLYSLYSDFVKIKHPPVMVDEFVMDYRFNLNGLAIDFASAIFHFECRESFYHIRLTHYTQVNQNKLVCFCLLSIF